jgi:hypothetical protein
MIRLNHWEGIMSTLTLLIIRHGEKPGEGLPGPGNAEDGSPDEHSLIIRGWQRAGAWAALFASGAFGPDYPKPDVVYAADPNKPAPEDGKESKRPWETVLPTCARLHVNPITSHGVGDEAALVDEVTNLTGVVLIAWEHKNIISGILPLLRGTQVIPHLPTKWKGSRFDVVLRFDRAQEGLQWSFRQLFPMLLSDDSDVPLKDEE